MKRFIQQKVAFTLAEVLITLGIIGVVAAITLPTLIQNYKKTVYVSQLKKTISVLQQGVQKMMVDDGVDNIEDTQIFVKMRNDDEHECYPGDEIDDVCKTFYDEFGQYLKVLKFGKAPNYNVTTAYGDTVDLSDNYYYFLQDGAMVAIEASHRSIFDDRDVEIPLSMIITIDVNGIKKPNQFGIDNFGIHVSHNGKFYYDSTIKKIISAGWKMDY